MIDRILALDSWTLGSGIALAGMSVLVICLITLLRCVDEPKEYD